MDLVTIKYSPYLLFRFAIQKNKNHTLSHINNCLSKTGNEAHTGKFKIVVSVMYIYTRQEVDQKYYFSMFIHPRYPD